VSTRARRLVALRSFLRFAARENWLPGDLGATLDVPTLPERLPKPLEPADRDQLLEALPHDTLAQKRDRALILLLLSTGARISEILRLDRSQWKPDRLWVVGKGDRERTVQVTDKARAAVDDYLTARTDHSPALFISFQPASKNTPANRLTVAGAQYVAPEQPRWPDAPGPVTTRPLTRDDLPLLHRWLHTPHVREWWRADPTTPTDIARKYEPRIDGVVPTRMFIIELRGEAVGLIQCYRHADHPDWDRAVDINAAAGID
jgi:hypothetical protein